MTKRPVRVVETVKEFMECLWELRTPSDTAVTLFRGQSDDYPLLPKLYRDHLKLPQIRNCEEEMLEALLDAAPHLRPSQPDNLWDWLSLGQHYGMSTRMSDWTANPLVALFFAVEAVPKIHPMVYRYPIRPDLIEPDKKARNPLQIKHSTAVQPYPHSHRSEVQAAWHIVHAIHKDDLDGEYRFHPLDEMPPHNTRIDKVEISRNSVPMIRAELKQMGMTPGSIYGDFGSVCRAIAPSFGLE